MKGSIGLTFAAAACTLGTQAAFAQATAFDLNGDGRITRPEFIAGRDARFAKYDRNRDRVITAADFPDGAGKTLPGLGVESMIAAADINKDGKITRNELGLSGTPLFDRADADGNGIVEKAEVAKFRAQIAKAK